MSLFEGEFICREHTFKTTNPEEAQTHLTTLPHYAMFGKHGRCRYCPKRGLYFHNVLYVGEPLLYDLICKECAKKFDRKPNAFEDVKEALLFEKSQN
jgi:hypothetical protein